MLASKMVFKTIREVPEGIDVPSHRLMLRAGMIHQVSAGIFSYLPLGWRAIQKIRAIIVQEMTAAGAQEINMPVVQPVELWEESGRASTFIPPLARFKDRRGHQMVLAPTHEETVTTLARTVINSYRDMPATLFHIQTKFRDELRCRAGLLRVREFEMKDAYSFDADAAGLDHSFNLMAIAYRNIFARCGAETVEVEADSGGIGGKESSEFVMLTKSGEDMVLICNEPSCNYAANSEKANFKLIEAPSEQLLPMERFETPGVDTIEKLAEFAGVPNSKTAKAVFYSADGAVVLVVIRGDLSVNETKLKNVLGATDIKIAPPELVQSVGLTPGYASPVGMDQRFKLIVDTSIENAPNLIGGANEKNYHLRNVNFGRDFGPASVVDIALAQSGYLCARCERGKLEERRGIEVGHIFKLGRIYAEKMDLTFQDRNGKPAVPLMGCYGIGLGRLLAAIVEANHDEAGIAFPVSIAPYAVNVVSLNPKDPQVKESSNRLYQQLLESGVEALWDDREDSPGVKLNDSDLIGYPIRAVVSRRGMESGTVEIKLRQAGTTTQVRFEDAAAYVQKALAELN